MKRGSLQRIILALAAACFITAVLASATHQHTGAAATKTECQVCVVAQARIIQSAALLLIAVALLAWTVLQQDVAAPPRAARVLPSPRAPPIR